MAKREDVQEQNYNCALKVYYLKKAKNSVFREVSKWHVVNFYLIVSKVNKRML